MRKRKENILMLWNHRRAAAENVIKTPKGCFDFCSVENNTRLMGLCVCVACQTTYSSMWDRQHAVVVKPVWQTILHMYSFQFTDMPIPTVQKI